MRATVTSAAPFVLSFGRGVPARRQPEPHLQCTCRGDHARNNARRKGYAAYVSTDRAGTVVARLYVAALAPMGLVNFLGSLDVTSLKRFTLMLAAAATFTLASSIPTAAQIIYPFPSRYPGFYPDASVHLDVTPKDSQVYVDGYYAGIVDDFDSMFQRLRVAPGQHEITIYRDGYRAVHERVYLTRDRTFKIKRALEQLPAGEVAEPRPTPAPLPAGAPAPLPLPRDRRGTPPNAPPQATPPTAGTSTVTPAATGRLAIQFQPSDASVFIDGQPWPASPGQDGVVVDLPEGRHVIQVRKPGYVGYLTEADVRRGETTTVNVSLRTQP